MKRITTAVVVAAALGVGAVALRAVSVSPMSVFMSHTNRTATITLYNGNPLPEEVDISFAFGYPQSDSAGNVTVPLNEIAPANEPSAVPWLRAFPRRLVLQPGQQQIVRILARPPAELADGEYWGRVLVTATGGRPPVEQQVQPDVRVSINMRTVVVASLNYRKGRLTTGIEVGSASAVRTDSTTEFTLDLARHGEAAWLGRIRIEMIGADGVVLHEQAEMLAVYRTIRRRFSLPATNIGRIRYTLETERPDLGLSNIITAPAVTGTVDVR